MTEDALAHATSVTLRGGAVLIRGPAGAGKSALALRLIQEAGARLVADDQTALRVDEHGRLIAGAPPAIQGRIEARGVGILAVSHVASAPVALVVDLVDAASVERIPDPPAATLLGVEIPRATLDPADPAIVSKLALALAWPAPTCETRCDAASLESGEPMTRETPETSATPPPAPADARGDDGRLPVVLVTGMSGAGRSTTLKALEDLGYEAIDNLPLHVLPRIVREGEVTGPLAIGVDIRTRNFSVQPFLDALAELRADPALTLTLFFLDSEDAVLRARFTETRRRHPLAQERPVSDGIAVERRLVAPLLAEADLAIDTSSLTVHDLRRIVASQLAPASAPGMVVFVTSFAYKAGVPREADLVFDARFMRNPHYVPELRPRTGQDPEVAAYVAADPDYTPIRDGLTGILARLMPRYAAEGKSYLTVAIGCTGGRHRSVALAEAIAAFLRGEGWRVIVHHREIGVRNPAEDAPVSTACGNTGAASAPPRGRP